jgi:hypothetical protein
MLFSNSDTTKLLIAVFMLICFCFMQGCNRYWYQEAKSYDECFDDREQCFCELTEIYDLEYIGKPEVQFVKSCMHAKGYHLLPEDRLPPRVKRRDPDWITYWFLYGTAGWLDE